MRGKSKKPPKYRLHKRSGQAVVTLNGHDHYLGKHNSPDSLKKYDTLIARWLSGGRRPIESDEPQEELRVLEVLSAYWRYLKDHSGSSDDDLKEALQEIDLIRYQLEGIPISKFGPLKVQLAQENLLLKGEMRQVVSKAVKRIQAAMRWGAKRELVPIEVSKAIETVDPPAISVNEICNKFLEHSSSYYVKDGQPTEEHAGIKAAIKRLVEEFGELPANELGPLKIQDLQQRFVRDGVSRYYVNKSINRLKRMFRWAVSQELIPPSISQAIDSVTIV